MGIVLTPVISDHKTLLRRVLACLYHNEEPIIDKAFTRVTASGHSEYALAESSGATRWQEGCAHEKVATVIRKSEVVTATVYTQQRLGGVAECMLTKITCGTSSKNQHPLLSRI